MAKRRARVIRIPLLIALLVLAACAETSRYRVLNFFFDGVPKPGEERARAARDGLASPDAQGPVQPARPKRPIYAHAPHKQNRCRACHNPANGLLLTTVQDGLCQTCHPNTPAPTRYLHGPVAVNDCIACHDPHSSYFPRLLRRDPKEICFHCHEPQHLTTGAHHMTIQERPCLECHDPHGGDGRFFLRRSER